MHSHDDKLTPAVQQQEGAIPQVLRATFWREAAPWGRHAAASPYVGADVLDDSLLALAQTVKRYCDVGRKAAAVHSDAARGSKRWQWESWTAVAKS